MANPNPQHNPTDGLGVAAYVVLSGGTGASALTNLSGGTLAHPGTDGNNGQGIGATEGKSGSVATAPGFPEAQYAMTLSLSGGGSSSYEKTAVLTAALVDAQNNSYSPVNNFSAKSYNNPSAGSPAWYKPSNFAGYSADVASVSAASYGVITVTALAVGQAIIEVEFPTFDNTEGNDSDTGNPKDMIYVQVVVTVIP